MQSIFSLAARRQQV